MSKPMPRMCLQRSLIIEVRKRRELWDYSHEKYNNKMVLLKAWDDIAKIFNTTSHKIKIKWRSLRDVYRKELLLHQKTGQPSTWIHYDRLSFLKNAYDYKYFRTNAVSSSDEKSDEQDSDEDSLTELKIIKTETLTTNELEIKEETMVSEDESNLLNDLSNDDELKHFLLSLLPEIEPMTNKQMREFKKEVCDLVKSILD